VKIGALERETHQKRITAAEKKYTRKTAGHTGTDYKTNTDIAKGIKYNPSFV
jgi:hypothetical protein